MNKKRHVKVLLDWCVLGLCLLALADLTRCHFAEFVQDCGFAILLLVLNLDWPRYGLKTNIHWPPAPDLHALGLAAVASRPRRS